MKFASELEVGERIRFDPSGSSGNILAIRQSDRKTQLIIQSAAAQRQYRMTVRHDRKFEVV